jgi:hypothetical protein
MLFSFFKNWFWWVKKLVVVIIHRSTKIVHSTIHAILMQI